MNRRRLAAGLVLGAAAAVVAWYVATRGVDEGRAAPAAESGASAAPSTNENTAASAPLKASAATAGGLASAPVHLPADAASGAPAASPTGTAHAGAGGPSSWELCGLGPVPAPPGAARPGGELPELPAPVGRDALEAVRERTLAALRQGDLRSRAAAQLLRPDAAAAAVDAEAARRSADAVALLWARARCPTDAEGAACRLALAQAAARAEPGNAEPWAQVAADDPAQADAAWHHIVQAERWDSHFGAFTATVLAAVPADVPAYLRMMLAVESFGIESTLPLPRLAPLLQRCNPGGAAAAGECDRLAQLLTQRSDTLLLAGVGRRVAEAAGWPPERLAAVDQELQTLRERTRKLEPDPRQPLGCASTQAFLGYLRQLPQGGEMAALRALARSAPR